jgi:hypothetical protein
VWVAQIEFELHVLLTSLHSEDVRGVGEEGKCWDELRGDCQRPLLELVVVEQVVENIDGDFTGVLNIPTMKVRNKRCGEFT